MDKKAEQKISIRFPVEVLDIIRQLARAHDRSFNGEVIWALREYAKRQPKPERRNEF